MSPLHPGQDPTRSIFRPFHWYFRLIVDFVLPRIRNSHLVTARTTHHISTIERTVPQRPGRDPTKLRFSQFRRLSRLSALPRPRGSHAHTATKDIRDGRHRNSASEASGPSSNGTTIRRFDIFSNLSSHCPGGLPVARTSGGRFGAET